jgi:cytochrome c biogenesis protein CcmG, thiol:disulfide interchange protein DsbE
MRRLKLVGQGAAVGLVVALLGLLVWKVAHQDAPGGAAAAFERGERKAAPGFTLERLDGRGRVSLVSLRGKVVVLNFWASWCGPCKKEAPLFQDAFERYRGRGVAVVGVDTNDYSGSAKRFLERYGVTYLNVRDRSGRVLAKYGGLPIPRTFLIDRSGRVNGYIFGEIRAEGLDRAIREALEA